MAMQGLLRDMGVAELIQHTCQDGKRARLLVENQGQQAELFFDGGQVVHARRGDQQGESVVYEILDWREGSFTLEPEVGSPARTIERSYAGLLLEGARRLDEGDHSSGELEAVPVAQVSEAIGHDVPGSMSDIARALASIEGVRGAILVAEDGVVLAQDLEGSDADRDGAVAAFVGAAAIQASQIMGLGPFRRAAASLGSEHLVVLRHQDYYAALVLAENAPAGLVASRAEGVLGEAG